MNKKQALERVSSLSRRIDKTELSLDAWKWQRAEAMAAAADAGATQREIAAAAGCGKDLVNRHIAVWRSVAGTETRPPFSEAYDAVTGFNRDEAQARTDRSRTKKTLADAPLEHVEQIISELPEGRQRAIAAAAGNEYLKARQDLDERERNLTPLERQERIAAGDAITEAGRRATAGFLSLGIAGHLEQATEELHELVADGSITPMNIGPITTAFRAFSEEYEVARAMAGLESDLQEVEQ